MFSKKKTSPWYDLAIKYLIFLLIILVPVVFLTQFYTVFSMPKLVVLRALTLVIVVLWLYKTFFEGKFVYYKSKFNWALLAFGAVCLITSIFSVSVFSSIFGAQGRFVGLITMINLLVLAFIIFNWCRSEKNQWALIKVTAITSTLLAVYGIFQFFGIFQESLNWLSRSAFSSAGSCIWESWSQDPAERVFGTVGHGNHFGAYLGINIILTLFLADRIKDKKWKTVAIIGAMIQIFTLALTGSRGAVLALVIALIYVAVVIIKNNYEKARDFFKKYFWLMVSLLMGVLVFIILIAFQIIKTPLTERIFDTFAFIKEGHLPDRISWWLSSLEMFKQRPLLGFGLGTFRDVYNLFRRTDFMTQAPGDMQDLITPEAAHNEYLNIAATQGLVGLVAFLALIYFAVRFIGKNKNKKNLLALALKGALVVYLVQAFFNFGVITTLTLFFLLLGLVAAVNDSNNHPAEILIRSWQKYLGLVLGLLLVCFAGVITVREALADFHYKQAVCAETQKNYEEAIINYQKAVNNQPFEYAYLQAFGDFSLKSSGAKDLAPDTQMKFLNLARIKYHQAINLNPHHPSTFYNLGVAEMQIYKATNQQTSLADAIVDFDKAIELAVNNPLYPYQAAKAYLGCSDPQCKIKAKLALQQALQDRSNYQNAQALLESLK